MRRAENAVISLLVLLCGVSGPAQDGAHAPGHLPREQVFFSALTSEEKPRLELAAGDFTLRVNGRKASIEGFRPGLPNSDRSRPVVAWILLDSIPGVDSRLIADQADAAARLFDLLEPSSSVGVQIISDRVEILAPLRHDPDALRKAFLRFSGSRKELKASSRSDTLYVGSDGIMGAIDLAITDLNNLALSEPSVKDKQVMRAVIIVSPANLNPEYNMRRLVDKAIRHSVFLYPVLVPVPVFGPWVQYYFDLAKHTCGVPAAFGALSPGYRISKVQRPTLGPNALNFNFIHVVRDLNGKYSFAAPAVPPGGKIELELTCLKKDVRIRLQRRQLP